MTVVALIPAYNEAERIQATVSALAAISEIDHVIVIDDGSEDRTAEKARGVGADVVELPVNSGKGAALDAGYARALARHRVEVLLLLDADLGDSASQASSLLGPVLAHQADMTVAAFPPPAGKAGFGLVKALARWGIKRLGSPLFEASAPLSGQRALGPKAVAACTPFFRGYGVEVALTVRALRAGLKVVEVQTTMTHAATGRDLAGFVHRGRQFAHVAQALLRLALERRTRNA